MSFDTVRIAPYLVNARMMLSLLSARMVVMILKGCLSVLFKSEDSVSIFFKNRKHGPVGNMNLVYETAVFSY